MQEIKTDCHECANDACLIKKNCLGSRAKSFLDKKNVISCKKSQYFILEGAPVHGLFFVYKGKAKVIKSGLSGREQIVRFAKDGDIVGHRGFGTGQVYAIGAAALEDTILCNFSNDVLHEMLHTIPSITYDLMLFYANQLNSSENKVKKFAQMSVREKVIDSILSMQETFGTKNGYIDILLSRKEIADSAGTTEEQAIRVISSLKKEGLVETKGRNIKLNNVILLSKETEAYS